jgi:hypothetical protein
MLPKIVLRPVSILSRHALMNRLWAIVKILIGAFLRLSISIDGKEDIYLPIF